MKKYRIKFLSFNRELKTKRLLFNTFAVRKTLIIYNVINKINLRNPRNNRWKSQ